MPNAPTTTYYPTLTGLRALAAFAVFGFRHLHLHLFGQGTLDVPVRAVLGALHIGVAIFFTLSGFLMTRRYAGRRFNGPQWQRYLLHRVARIWLVYLLLVVLTFAASYPIEGRANPLHWLAELGVEPNAA